MKYLSFEISHYRGITKPLYIDLKNNRIIPMIGINECGKTTILQAIYCFDYINDGSYNGKHMADKLNLYDTNDDLPPIVTAEIEIKYTDITLEIEKYNAVIIKNNEAIANEDEKGQLLKFPIKKENYSGFCKISRNLNSEEYTFLEDDFSILNPIAKEIVSKLPYILYNDDFMDRPPNTVEIPEEEPEDMDTWLSIYERLFNVTNANYSLFKLIKEDDERRRDSIISDVEEELNKRLTKAWKTFLLSKHGKIDVKLKLKKPAGEQTNHTLVIKIVEKIGKKERFFDVVDRSKGFLWFFNFVMKLEFNPKIIGNKKNTINLLDEPGSYLHSTAQEKLCNKLKSISENEGIVIYCTHSHHLLNPEIIPLNKIYIVEKEKNKNIKASLIQNIPLKKNNNISAYQPILEALQIPDFDLCGKNIPIIAVEGIYDKYVIELFTKLNFDYKILPGVNANSIVKNIQYLNGFGKQYIAIWDNDPEGVKEYNRAVKSFGEIEAKKFDKLPLKERTKRRMEEMFENDDINKIKNKLKLEENSSYEKILVTLYYLDNDERKKIISSISKKTKDNFIILEQIISKRFGF